MASNTKFKNYVVIDDGANLDAFSRLRVSNPITVFDSQHQYNTSPIYWQTALTGTGVATHLPNESSVALTCGTVSGDKVIRQTKRYIRYQPSKATTVFNTFVVGSAKNNVRKRLGFFDDNNGIFLEQTINGLYIVRRTYTSGSPFDNRVIQANWNIDKMDGNGLSGFNLDITKAQILVIDAQWLGVGRVRIGFDIDGSIFYVHEFYNANNLDVVYTSTFNLPVRFEIENTGITDSHTTLKQICSAVVSEGGVDIENGITHSDGNGVNSISVLARRPVVSVRPKATFNDLVNRGEVTIESFDIITNGTIFYEIVYNGTLTNATFAKDPSVNSITLYDVVATAITGGEVIDSGFLSGSTSARGGTTISPKSKYTLSNDILGTTTDIITIVATSFANTQSVNAQITVKEIY